MTQWVEYLDRDPEDFVAALLEARGAGDPDATMALNVLATCQDAAGLVTMIAPFREHPEVGYAVKLLEEHTAWIDQVLALLHEPSEPAATTTPSPEDEPTEEEEDDDRRI